MISTFTATLEERKALTPHVYSFIFKCNDILLDFEPGQYVILHIPQADGHPVRRLYSIASPATQKDRIELIVEILENGLASQHLMKMAIGDTITMQGPAGMFTLRNNDRNVVFLATGTGIAPIKSMILKLVQEEPQKKIYLFWGFPTFDSMYLYEDFKKMAQQYQQLTFINCMSREQDLSSIIEEDHKFYQLGHVNDKLDTHLGNDFNAYQYYLCGGPKVIESLREFLAEKGVEKENIHFEKFTV